eukprot:1175649-Prorocentrum_minimum.AAC.4
MLRRDHGCVERMVARAVTPNRAAPHAARAEPLAARNVMASPLSKKVTGTAHTGPNAPSAFQAASGMRKSAHVPSVGAVNVTRSTPATVASQASRLICGRRAHAGSL